MKSCVLLLLLASLCSLYVLHRISTRRPSRSRQSARLLNHTWKHRDETGGWNCTVHECVHLAACARRTQLTVFVEPLLHILAAVQLISLSSLAMWMQDGSRISPSPSREFLLVRETIARSAFAVASRVDACLILPGIDTLNLHRFPPNVDPMHALHSIPGWHSGTNHVVFLFAGALRSPSRAIIASAHHHPSTYRRVFDVAIPPWNPFISPALCENSEWNREFRLAVISRGRSPILLPGIHSLSTDPTVLILTSCDPSSPFSLCDSSGIRHEYPRVLQRAEFCLIAGEVGTWQLFDAVLCGCIPVVFSNLVVLPFEDVIEWKRIAVIVRRGRVDSLTRVLSGISTSRRSSMRERGAMIQSRIATSISSIVLRTLELLQARLIPSARGVSERWTRLDIQTPLFLPRIAPNDGFTALIVCFICDVARLFAQIRHVARVASLERIVVVWRNDDVLPPSDDEWPRVSRAIRVLAFPPLFSSYENEIHTEAVFAISSEAISNLPPVDVIHFAYQVWRENPSQLIGFATSLRDTIKREQSTNDVTHLFTAAAFYHQYYRVIFRSWTKKFAGQLKDGGLRACKHEQTAIVLLISHLNKGKSPLLVETASNFTCHGCDSAMESSQCVALLHHLFPHSELTAPHFHLNPMFVSLPSQFPS